MSQCVCTCVYYYLLLCVVVYVSSCCCILWFLLFFVFVFGYVFRAQSLYLPLTISISFFVKIFRLIRSFDKPTGKKKKNRWIFLLPSWLSYTSRLVSFIFQFSTNKKKNKFNRNSFFLFSREFTCKYGEPWRSLNGRQTRFSLLIYYPHSCVLYIIPHSSPRNGK